MRYRLLFLNTVAEITFAPVNLLAGLFLHFFSITTVLLLVVFVLRDLLSLLLRLTSLVLADLLVLLFAVVVEFAGALVSSLAHLLPHQLAEGRVAATVGESTLGQFCLCFFCLELECSYVGLGESLLGRGLPCC